MFCVFYMLTNAFNIHDMKQNSYLKFRNFS